ncbi:MAG TPA: SDR family oxidoreductase [Gemmatimonadaceae bacterium]|jgi:NAD(P)-dependent dehydrogenase (short-subunit alcohol dehydrogenase family)
MTSADSHDLTEPGADFSLGDKTALVTGGYGVLGGTIASGLAAAGARVIIVGRRRDAADAKADELRAGGASVEVAIADVLDEASLRATADDLATRGLGEIDILVNAAGGNVARARSDNRSVFEIPLDAFDEVLRLNLHGTVAPTMILGDMMAKRGRGSIVNISSMAAMQALSGVMGYSVAKAGIDTFTRWMAVDLARRFGDGIRVNAIAPGFFLSEQNRAVLVSPDGSPTERAKKIIDRTPMARFGHPRELIGAVQWLCSDASSFVTGVVIPVDGGFSAFSGI